MLRHYYLVQSTRESIQKMRSDSIHCDAIILHIMSPPVGDRGRFLFERNLLLNLERVLIFFCIKNLLQTLTINFEMFFYHFL